MADGSDASFPGVPAGSLSSWVVELRAALRDEAQVDVPCDGCTACCRSAQFVHIGPDETDTLARIPAELLFPAPRRPKGHLVLGYDERGHCPMLVEDRCSIYEHRPRTCRTYDCRVFTAAGVEPEKPAIAERTRRWRFDLPARADRDRQAAIRAAAAFVRERVPEATQMSPADIAVSAVEIHELFLGTDGVVDPDPVAARAAVRNRT